MKIPVVKKRKNKGKIKIIDLDIGNNLLYFIGIHVNELDNLDLFESKLNVDNREGFHIVPVLDPYFIDNFVYLHHSKKIVLCVVIGAWG